MFPPYVAVIVSLIVTAVAVCVLIPIVVGFLDEGDFF